MGHVSIDMEIEATPEEVWDVVSDPRNLPKWDRHIIAVRGVPSDGLAEGVRYTTDLKMLGVRGTIEAEVLEIEPPKRSRIRLRGLLDATVNTLVSPLSGGKRALLEHDVQYHIRGGGLAAFATQGLELTGGPGVVLRRGAMAQKRQIEELVRRRRAS
jgi:uncharacterized protein YndB with AHSA1/START domain